MWETANFAAEILTEESRTIPEGEEFPGALLGRLRNRSMDCRWKIQAARSGDFPADATHH